MTTIKFCSDSLCLCNVVGVTFYDNATILSDFMYGYYCVIKKKFPRKTQHTFLFTPGREPMTGHSTDTTKVQ